VRADRVSAISNARTSGTQFYAANERLWLDDDQRAAPVEEARQRDQKQPRSLGGPARLGFAFLKQSKLLSQKQIFGDQRCARGNEEAEE